MRDLHWDGDDLLVVVGTVMSGDGPAAVLRVPAFAARDAEGVVGDDAIEGAAELPYRGRVDHPEGIADAGDGRWLVVYDSPAPDRLDGEAAVRADLVRLDAARPRAGDPRPPRPRGG